MTDQIHLSPLALNHALHRFRLPPRRLSLRNADYEDKFDFLTLFCDILWDKSYSFVHILCPKLLNLWEELNLEFYEVPSGQRCEHIFLEGDYSDRIEVHGLEAGKALRIKGEGIALDIAIQPSLCDYFQGRRVVFAMTQNNDLQWIADWAEFYVQEHGADGILLYDHQTTIYRSDEIEAILQQRLPAEARVAVVRWPFPYGVFDIREAVGQKIFDSCYCQSTIFEHARWRFLQDCRSVVNADIDELILCDREQSIFELTEKSATGYLQFSGHWILPRRLEDVGKRPRHSQFLWMENDPSNRTEMKWSVVPSRCLPQGQWMTHNISAIFPDVRSCQVCLRHFMGISTNWTVDRIFAEVARADNLPDAERQEKDTQLEEAFKRVGSSRQSFEMKDSRPEDFRAYMWRITAGRKGDRDKPDQAMECIDQALKILESPSFLKFKSKLYSKIGDSLQARRTEERLEELLQTDASAICQKAINQIEQLNFLRGEELLQQALELDPSLIEIYEAYDTLLVVGNRHDERRDLLRELTIQIQLHRNDMVWLYRAAMLLEQHASFMNEARRAVSLAIQQESNSLLKLMQIKLDLALGDLADHEEDLLALAGKDLERSTLRFSESCIRPTVLGFENVPIRALHLLGGEYVRLKRYRAAKRVYCAALHRDPLSLASYIGLASIHRIEGLSSREDILMARAVEIANLIDKVYTRQGSRLASPLDGFKGRVEARNRMYRIQSRKQDYLGIESSCLHYLASQQTLPIEKQHAIEKLFKLGRVEAAKHALQQHQGLFGQGQAHYLHSQLQAAQGKFEAALNSLEQARESLGDQTYLLRMRTLIHRFRDDDLAIIASQEDLIGHRSADPNDYQQLAIHHQTAGRLYSAIDITLKGLERFSQNPDLKALDSKLTQRREDIAQAAARLTKEIAAPGSQARPDVLQAARKICSTAIDGHLTLVCDFVARGMPSEPMKQFFTGWIAYLEGDFQVAYNNLADAYQGPDSSALTCYLLGLAAYETQADGFGIAYFKEALQKNSNHTIWRFALAKALVAAGQPEQASDELVALLRQRPSHMASQGLWRMIHARPIRDEELRI